MRLKLAPVMVVGKTTPPVVSVLNMEKVRLAGVQGPPPVSCSNTPKAAVPEGATFAVGEPLTKISQPVMAKVCGAQPARTKKQVKKNRLINAERALKKSCMSREFDASINIPLTNFISSHVDLT